jgi:CBS domain-containing protein
MSGLWASTTGATEALTIAPQESLRRAAQLMTENAVAHLVVVDAVDLRPVGILTTLDVAAACAE